MAGTSNLKLGICVTYTYDGDPAPWENTIGTFIAAVSGDAELAGKFSYNVHRANEGGERIHIGRWDSPETVKLLQSRDYFKTFAGELQALAGDSLKSTLLTVSHSTG